VLHLGCEAVAVVEEILKRTERQRQRLTSKEARNA
jgi:hypothetical protein